MSAPFDKLSIYKIPNKLASHTQGNVAAGTWVILTKEEFSVKELIDLLRKILSSIEIELESQVFILTISELESFYLSNMLTDQVGKKLIFAFGISPFDLGMALKATPNQLFQLKGHRFIFTDGLKIIKSESSKKRALWEAIQNLKISQ